MRGDAKATIDALRARIEAIEQRPVLAEKIRFPNASETGETFRILDLVSAPEGLFHEIFADEQRDGTAALGFAFGLARSLLNPGRPALIYLQLTSDTQEIGLPYAEGFGSFGIQPDDIVFGRVETITELLWAMEESVACRAVAAVIADVAGFHKAIDFTVSRRLNMRATASGTTVFFLRYGTEREASASMLRWRVAPLLSGEAQYDPQSPGPPRFAVMLEKGRVGGHAQRLEGQSFVLDWMDHHGFVLVERSPAGRAASVAPPAPSRPLSATLGDRLSQAS